jgi:glycosyltransferase involved in cell wall biosynthesis
MSIDTGSPERRPHALLVAYYFPPMGGSGVQRVAKWCKYLPENGWDVTVLTVEPGSYFAFDEDLLDEVKSAGVQILRTTSLDPTRVGGSKKQVGLQSERKRRIFAWLTGLFFIPDNKKGWLKPALAAVRSLIAERPVDLVLSSAPPYTAFLVGAAAAKTACVPHLMDYRDDWLDNPRHRYPSPWHARRHRQLEQDALSGASLVTAINEAMAQRILKRSPDTKVRILPQGFDPEDMTAALAASPRSSGAIRFLYAGMFYDAQQPDVFLQGVSLALERDPALRDRLELRFVGLFPEAKRSLVRSLGLADLASFPGYLSHAHTVQELMQADVLWMTIGRQEGEEMISTGKLFEYIGTRKPILALVPDGAARGALSGYEAAWIADPDDVDAVADRIATIMEAAERSAMPVGNEAWVGAFDRREQTRLLADWMSALAGQRDH